MKNAQIYSAKIRKLLAKLRRDGGKVQLESSPDMTTQLLESALSNYAAEARAHAAINRLRTHVVDLNELRVTPTSEVVEIIGPDFPFARAAAEDLCRSLNAIYNKVHQTNLEFLKKYSKRSAENFLNGLGGLPPYAAASVILRCLGGHAIPVDIHMLAYLRRNNYVEPDVPVEQVQKFLASVIKESEAAAFYVLLKRHASSHAPKFKASDYRGILAGGSPAPTPPPPAPPKSAEEAAAARKPQTAAHATARPKGGSKNPSAPPKSSARRGRQPARTKNSTRRR